MVKDIILDEKNQVSYFDIQFFDLQFVLLSRTTGKESFHLFELREYLNKTTLRVRV